MKLKDLGFDSWFDERVESPLPSGCSIARVTAIDRGGGLVRGEGGEVPFRLTGKLQYSAGSSIELPCVGDWVYVQYHDAGTLAVIHDLLPRRTFLRRKSPGADVDFQMIAANIDVAFIVQSCDYDFNLRRIDRYLVMTNEGGIEPVLVLTKTDLIEDGDLERMIAAVRKSGIAMKVATLSNKTGAGLNEFQGLLTPGKTYCLLGSSGVGKTTIINRLKGREAYQTRPVSGTGAGVHTTTRRQLIVLEQGALLIDTPGMRELGVLAEGGGIDRSFADIHDFSGSCQYADCTHTQEPGCAVLAAVRSGALNEDRYRSYLKLRQESEFHELSYLEKRKKDRAFGKFIKSAKKQLKK
jgi:ribosome biogenesis GTPase